MPNESKQMQDDRSEMAGNVILSVLMGVASVISLWWFSKMLVIVFMPGLF